MLFSGCESDLAVEKEEKILFSVCSWLDAQMRHSEGQLCMY